jgi:hypothetical protein
MIASRYVIFTFVSTFETGHGTNGSQIISAIQTKLEEQQLPETELIQSIWQGLMASVDWSARPDQIEGLALREVGVSHSIFVSLNFH